MHKPSIIALIPARAGSIRVPGKNIRKLGHFPMMAYTIKAARESGIFDAIVLSTDSEEYGRIGLRYGAEVPFLRPEEFSTKVSPDIDWIEYTLKTLASRERSFDCFSILRPTSPFRNAETIRRAWKIFLSDCQKIDSLRAVEKCTQHPGKMWVIKDSYMTPLLSGKSNGQPWHSSQYAALPEVYVQNASLEIGWTRLIFENRSIAGEIIKPFMTEGLEGFDINNEEDWLLAEMHLKQQPLHIIEDECFAS